MIDKIQLKFGMDSIDKLTIPVTPITVFVGPNNSGKSKVLREIEAYCRETKGHPSNLILDKLFLSSLDWNDLERELNQLKVDAVPSENIYDNNIIISKISPQHNMGIRMQLSPSSMKDESENPNLRPTIYYKKYLDLFTLRLDGTNRLNLLNEREAGDLLKVPSSHLSQLFINNPLRLQVRKIVFDAVGRYFVIDPTHLGMLRVRLSDNEPKSEQEERGLGEESINFHKKALSIESASDGLKAFTGIISTILAGDPKITLIDEPEAFLHPALANILGKEIGNSLRNSIKRLFVATHSSNFLMGCIQSGIPLNIVRLTYKDGNSTARLLPPDKILHIMRHPLLRSTGVLNGLFFESVVVCEADSDRAFYQEINERLLSENDKRAISNCLFINAQNKQTVWDIVKPLRELGIPTAGIVDIDVIKEGGVVFTKLLTGAFIPELNRQFFNNQRQVLYDTFKSLDKDFKRDGGIKLLVGENREACNNFFEQLTDYGVYIVKNGELESWLKNLGASSHGSNWLINIFEKMGENPDDINYLKPSNGDVWDFIGDLKVWLSNENRKGIPK
ncbi:ATP-dependent nuclease [Elizabethkingia anophelis]|uniref:ATP-dependent nuclease n=2 Tax=Elizabethkingia anophelis TaxID=1117645 RepID=UPI0038929A3B|nr:ATP-binding protein [Elizabethkingia anophelis]HAY3509530.1 ATP-binding protein [Elizabethkingia anophelis]